MGFDKGYYDRCCACCKCVTAYGQLAFGVLTIILSVLTGMVAIENDGTFPVWYLILGILTCVSYC